MHKNNFVVSVKNAGKALKEKDDTVFMPFGSEYGILLKNLDSRKASVKVTIDGEDVLDGRTLVVDGNDSMNLERFFGDDMDKGRRFRFIEKTQKISDHRGDKDDDGILRVEVTYEMDWSNFHLGGNGQITMDSPAKPYWMSTPQVYCSQEVDGINANHLVCGPTSINMNRGMGDVQVGASLVDTSSILRSAPGANRIVDSGITVKGSESDQKFKDASIGILEGKSTVFTLSLKGIVNETPVKKPLTKKKKIQCPTCGDTWGPEMNYCGDCGTFLDWKSFLTK